VGYQVALVEAPTAGAADVLLAAVLLVALAVRRRPLERAALAARASAWAAAASPPALPRVLRRDARWRRFVVVGAVLAVVVAALPPLWLAPSGDVRYGTGAAFVLAAVAASAAWIFCGEIAIGHWGVAALGATVTHAAPGPLAARALLGVAIGAVAGLALGVLARRRGGLAAPVAGLALAVAAPYWLVRAGTPSLDLDPAAVASLGGAVAAVAAVGVALLRSTPSGIRLVAARDEPRRAAGLRVSPARAMAGGMGLSGALAAAAGVLYLAAVPAGVAPGAFDAGRSFDVVAFAVVGGLGSAVGAAVGAAALLVAGVVLPSPWASVATGAGVVWVVLFAPAGVSGALVHVRDLVARRFLPRATPAQDEQPAEPIPPEPAEAELVVVGADTREATATPTIRATMTAAGLAAAPASAALLGGPMVLADHLDVTLGAGAPWFVLGTALVAAGVALARWRRWRPTPGAPPEALVAGTFAAALVAFVVTGDRTLVAALVVVAPLAGAYVLAGASRSAASVVVPRVRAAASGVVVASAVVGLTGALHLGAVAGGNDLLDAARCAALYITGATVALLAAAGRAPADRRRALDRLRTPVASTGRRRWAPLRVDSLTVDFGDHRILEAVDLEVGSGEVVALVGGNGAGKSTLLRAVAGFVPVSAGRVDVAGQEVTALRPDERAAAGAAFVSGAQPVFPDLTVRENLRVGGYLTHRSRRSFTAALEHVLAAVPVLADRLDTRAGLLSGGEQRQLAVAQTLFRRPAVLLVDELTLGLDAGAQASVLALLRTLAADGIGVVVVDHDVDALARAADRVVLVRAGRLEAFDDVAAFTDARQDLLPARFLAHAGVR
jgi:branched-chain amino acid transport system ATP-binding protein